MELLTYLKTSFPNSGGVLPLKVIEVRPKQSQKARSPILVTEFGMVMEVRPEQPSKAKPPILVTEFGIVVFLHPAINLLVFVSIIALQLSLLSYFVFLFSTVIEVRPKQSLKALYPILVTELEIVMEVRLEQKKNIAISISYLS